MACFTMDMSSPDVWSREDVAQSSVRNRDFPDGPYQRGTLLGQGGFAVVYKVLKVRDGSVYAGKTSPKAVDQLRREANVLRSIKHDRFVKYIDYYEEEGNEAANVLVLELCAEGNLQTLINNHSQGVGRKDTLQVMHQLSQALEYLHGKRRFHGDFKPRNILIRSWNPVNVVVADCADVMSVDHINSHKKPHGTKAYWSPHVWRRHRHAGTSDDIWALGVTLLGMMSQWPLHVKNQERQYPRRCFTHAQSLLELNPGHNIVGLLRRMLIWDEKHRVSAAELVELTAQMVSDSERGIGLEHGDKMDLKVPEDFKPIEFWSLSWLMSRSILTTSPSQPVLRTALQSITITPRRHVSRAFSSSISAMSQTRKLKPAARVEGQKKDVWSIINEAAAASPIQPIVNMGQGFFGYNPPKFILDAAKDALDRVDCNQYAPAKGRPRLRKAIANAYSPFWGRELDPETEIVVTTGANEGMLSAFMAFVEPGDEVIVFEPFFDQYISNIQMAGGKIVYVPLHPPSDGATKNSSAADWTIDFDELEKAVTPRTKMIVINTPHNPVGKVFHKDELEKIGDLCVKNQIIILSDEVYDRLYYVPFTRISRLSPEVEKLTLTVGSAGKNFYATGWRVGWLIGPSELIQHVLAAHTRICFSTVAPLQEASAVGFELADANGFWDETIKEMKGKVDRLNEVFEELNLPVTYPEGGYFLLVNMAKVQLPEDYPFPEHVASRPRDFKLAWFLIQEVGVAAIPPTEFYTEKNAHLAENYIRFAVCKEDEVLEQAKERLRSLKKYIKE
ncbi:hypothetical protein FZEAL_5943 [Fusarium zealandicum]|uniref:Protein kinase domain-containing protein n=1 Tax=Fusarium zealandicum TaxID=1053134 RepID=A0A8H4UJB2_9HYPO|nr:hypothetical protein FZEAL_5943 [Fusarium zealandicum]